MRYLALFCLALLPLRAEFFFTPKMIETHLKTYSEEEKKLIEKDLEAIWSLSLDGTENTDIPFYLATAGAPGARKTTILEHFVSEHPEYQKGIYLDPDPRTLRFMINTYYAQSLTPLVISKSSSYDAVIQAAYEKWRYASNYIVLTLFEDAMSMGRSVIYGTTSTGSHIADFLARLKEKNYQIILLLCSCSDELRHEAVEYRNNTLRFYQSSPDDAVSKGKLFPQRMGAYFAYADVLYFYWSDELKTQERLAAVWRKGDLEVNDQEAFNFFVDKYEADRKALIAEGQILPSFDTYLK